MAGRFRQWLQRTFDKLDQPFGRNRSSKTAHDFLEAYSKLSTDKLESERVRLERLQKDRENWTPKDVVRLRIVASILKNRRGY